MKLVFPNGEHGQVLLNPGVNRIGSSAEAAVVLTVPGIAPEHCTIHVTQTGANLQVPSSGGPVEVNGKRVADLMALRAGDNGLDRLAVAEPDLATGRVNRELLGEVLEQRLRIGGVCFDHSVSRS